MLAAAGGPRPARAASPRGTEKPGKRDLTIGFVLTSEEFTGPQLVEFGVAAEQAGFDAVWTSDHFLPWQDNQGHAGHAWVLLGALAQRTKRVKLGTGVTCPIYRYPPAIVAQAFASLSSYAPGRIFLGCGKGEALNEFAATGQWDADRVRRERWIEAMEVIRALWSGKWIDHHGTYYSVAAKLYEAPAGDIPLYVAAAGTKSVGVAARMGDGWIADPKTALNPQKRAAFADAAKASGRDPNARRSSSSSGWSLAGSGRPRRPPRNGG